MSEQDSTIEGEHLPAEPEQEEEVVADSESLLNFTQNIRHQLARSFIAKGMPETKEEQSMLLATLRDMDQTSINRIKADIDSQALESDRRIQEMVNELHRTMPTGLRAPEPTGHQPEVKVDELPEFEQAPGELSEGVEQESAEDFMNRMENKNE